MTLTYGLPSDAVFNKSGFAIDGSRTPKNLFPFSTSRFIL